MWLHRLEDGLGERDLLPVDRGGPHVHEPPHPGRPGRGHEVGGGDDVGLVHLLGRRQRAGGTGEMEDGVGTVTEGFEATVAGQVGRRVRGLGWKPRGPAFAAGGAHLPPLFDEIGDQVVGHEPRGPRDERKSCHAGGHDRSVCHRGAPQIIYRPVDRAGRDGRRTDQKPGKR